MLLLLLLGDIGSCEGLRAAQRPQQLLPHHLVSPAPRKKRQSGDVARGERRGVWIGGAQSIDAAASADKLGRNKCSLIGSCKTQ